MATQSSPRTVWVVDERAPRPQLAALSAILTSLKRRMPITILKLSRTSESDLLARLKKEPCDLLIVPCKQYLQWNSTELLLQNNFTDAHVGRNRGRGAVFVGILDQPLSPDHEGLASKGDSTRRILLDCFNLATTDLFLILQTMIQDTRKSGIQSMLAPTTPIYSESWYHGQGPGGRIESVIHLPEIHTPAWSGRMPTIRTLMSALWGVIYEEGPGKPGALANSDNPNPPPVAYFQIAADGGCLAIRLGYRPLSHGSPHDILSQFSLHAVQPARGTQLLLRYADFVRVHVVPENGHVELLVCLFPSAPAEKNFNKIQSLWIEQISEGLIQEKFYEMPSYNGPDGSGSHPVISTSSRLRPMPAVTPVNHVTHAVLNPAMPQPTFETPSSPDLTITQALAQIALEHEQVPKRLFSEATQQIRDLQNQLKTEQDKIKELKSGGVGMPHPLPPPDAEDLLTAFQERYFDSRFLVRQLETQLADLEKDDAKPYELERLRIKITALENRERAWIRRLIATLQDYRTAIQSKG